MRRLTVLAVAVLLLATTGCGDGYHGASPSYRYEPGPDLAGGPVFGDYGINPEVLTSEENRATFALDVDTGSYTVTRGYLTDGLLPDPVSVRTEEFVNYFTQDYPPPADGLGIHLDGTPMPFLDDPYKRVIRVGIQARVVDEADRPPTNLTFIVDTSGSMAGRNLEMVTAGLGRLVDTLRPDDRVAVVTFSDSAELRLAMTPVTEQEAVRAVIAALAPQASTNLEAGLRLGYAHAREHLRSDGINRVILLSDGEANRGQTDPDTLAAQIAREAGRDTQLVVIGVGRQTYNEVILEQFANNGNGFYAYIDTVREAERLFVHELSGTLQAVALDAKVQVTFNPAVVSRFRLLGYENRQLDHDDLRDDMADGGEVGAGHTVTALFEITLAEGETPAGDTPLAVVDLRWIDPDHAAAVEHSATLAAADLTNSFDRAPPRLRQDILVAGFAECLRGAPWSAHLSLAGLAEAAQQLSRQLPGDERVAEFAQLVATAADVSS
jgi:Ca-activated chloride channel homolog